MEIENGEGGDWQGCVLVRVEPRRRLPHIRGTRIITAQDGFTSPRVSLHAFSYNGFKCINCIFPLSNRILCSIFYETLRTHSLKY